MSALAVESRHCEERSDAAIHKVLIYLHQWIASLTLAMTIFIGFYTARTTTTNAYIARKHTKNQHDSMVLAQAWLMMDV
jgi:hypothetical protein